MELAQEIKCSVDFHQFDSFMVKVARALINSIDEGKRCTGVKLSISLIKLFGFQNRDLLDGIMGFLKDVSADQCSEVRVAIMEGIGKIADDPLPDAIIEKVFMLVKSLFADGRNELKQQTVDTLINLLHSEGMSSKKEEILSLYIDLLQDKRNAQVSNYAFTRLDELLEAIKHDQLLDSRILDVFMDKIEVKS